MKSLNPRTRKLGINIDNLTAKDPKAARLMDELKLLHQAPRVDPEVREKHLALLETVNRALAPTPRGQNDRERGGTSMNTEQPGYSAIFDPFAGPVLPHPRPSRLSSLGRAARNVMAGLTVGIGLAAGGVTIVHYVWGSNPPMPIPVVKVTVSVAQPSGHTVPPSQRGSIGAAPASLRAKQVTHKATLVAAGDWYGLTTASIEFGNDWQSERVNSVAINTVPANTDNGGSILELHVIETGGTKSPPAVAFLNVQRTAGADALIIPTAGCADDSASIGAEAKLKIVDQSGRVLATSDIKQGQPAASLKVGLDQNVRIIEAAAVPVTGQCVVTLVDAAVEATMH